MHVLPDGAGLGSSHTPVSGDQLKSTQRPPVDVSPMRWRPICWIGMSGEGHSLNLWQQQLGCVPDTLWDRVDLESLVLANNALSEVSERVGGLRRLRMLDLGHNQLTNVPDALGHLEALTDFLYLHDNQLRSLPASLGKLRLLRYLNLSDNAFEVLPEAVAGMCGLVELRAEQNRLASLPNWIGDLGLLRELHLRGNRLTSVPGIHRATARPATVGLAGQSGGPPSVCDCQPAAARQARPALGHNVAVARLAGRSRGPRLPHLPGDFF